MKKTGLRIKSVASLPLRIKFFLNPYRLILTTYFLLLTTYHLPLTTALYSEGFKIEQVKPKIITPASSPGINDILIVFYNNPNDSNISGRILTINGSYVADMLVNDSDPYKPKITWDGKDGNSVVPSGIYIYQIETEGQVFNGTVVVAK